MSDHSGANIEIVTFGRSGAGAQLTVSQCPMDDGDNKIHKMCHSLND